MGNRLTQFLSNSTLKPTAVGSALKVAVQILSRSALENSQVPIMSLAESPSVGACASAAPPAASASSDRRQAKHHARFGGYGVSATGVSGGLPAAQARMLSTTSWSIAARVATLAEPRCGNSTT